MEAFTLSTALEAIAARRDEAQVREQGQRNIAGRSRLDPNSPAERIARAKVFEKDIRDQIEWLQEQPDSAVKTQRMKAALDRLGELAAEQGAYEQAAQISRTTERRHYYESIVAAIEETETCQCPDELVIDRQRGIETREPSMMHYDTLTTPEGGTMTLMKCIKCGHLLAK